MLLQYDNYTIIYEHLKIKDNKLHFDYSNNDDGGINISLGKSHKTKFTPYIKSLRITHGIVYSLYQLDAKDKQILKVLKDEIPDITYDNNDVIYFAKRSALYAYHNLRKDIDIILYKPANYLLFTTFIQELASKFQNKTLLLSDSIYKTTGDKLYIRKEPPEKYKKDVYKLLEKLRQKQEIKLHKDIPIQFRYFFSGFISIKDEIQNKIKDKNILIVDDVLTTGLTLDLLFELLQMRNAKSMIGLTLFKIK